MRQSGQKYKYSSAERARVETVRFGLMSKDEIEKWTVTDIKDINDNSEHGLGDLRMGVSTNHEECLTCGETVECPGHFGHIKLAKPVYHIGFIETVAKVLRCICYKCGRLREDTNQKGNQESNKMEQVRKMNRINSEKKKSIEMISGTKKRLTEMSKILNSKNKCNYCDIILPKKIQVKEFLQLYVTIEDKEERWRADKVLFILQEILPDVKIGLGFSKYSKPEDLIIQNLLVCPPQVRPSVEMNGIQKSRDDITRVYENIIKKNNQILEQLNMQASPDLDKLVDAMEMVIARLMDNDKERMAQLQVGTAKKPVKSIKQRLKGKEGRFRQHLMGKRVDFSARSVVSPDSNLALDELGVPRSIAENLTLPEEVTQYNIKWINELAKQGKIKVIIKPKQGKMDYEYLDATKWNDAISQEIAYGVTVERSLLNGDYVLFNRQPTLHKMSMMCHRVRILPYSTFRLNLSVCTPYNADFDGDEMNMHVPQSYETRAELKNICHVPTQIVTPKANKPVMGIVQDALLGISLFTLRDTFLTKEQVMNLIMWVDDWDGQLPMPAIMKPQPLWTGKQLISLIIPKKITMQRQKNYFDETDESLYIEQGELLMGIMMKSYVGDGPSGLVHIIWLDLGPQACNEFMTRAQRLVNNWLIINTFTMSCSDIVPSAQFEKKVNDILDDAEKEFNKILTTFQDKQKVQDQNLHKAGKKILDSFEVQVNDNLNKQRQKVEKQTAEEINYRYNNFKKMVWAGSKGKDTNLAQVMGIVGQQNIEGARIRPGFNRRTLPHFCKDDHGLESRGFVKRNFFNGLNPMEFFFHTMGGREGLSDTAVKTSRTGYIQRKLVKAIEDVTVQYDATVRDSNGSIIQTVYGEDGLAGEYIEDQRDRYVWIIECDRNELERNFRFIKPEWENDIERNLKEEYGQALDEKVISELSKDPSQVDKLEDEFARIMEARQLMRQVFYKEKDIQNVHLAVNIQRILEGLLKESQNLPQIMMPSFQLNQQTNLHHHHQGISQHQQRIYKCDLNPSKVYIQVCKLIEDIENEFAQRNQERCLELFKAHLRLSLNSRDICIKHRFSESVFEMFLQKIMAQFRKSQIHPGETIGAIAAQSIGEPTTQMTLNTFHFAGVSERNVTLGVPRLQELLDASKRIKTPSLTIYMDPPLKEDKANKNKKLEEENIEKIKMMKLQLQYDKLSNYVASSEIFYDPDKRFYEEGFNKIFDENENQSDSGENSEDKWTLRLNFDKEKLNVNIYDSIKQRFNYEKNIQFQMDIFTSEHISANIRCRKTLDMFNQPMEMDGTDDISRQQQRQMQGQQKDQQELSALNRLEKIEQDILFNMILGGITGIQKVYNKEVDNNFQINEITGKIEKLAKEKNKKIVERVLETDGTNLKEVLIFDGIDTHRTVSNDVNEIAIVLGIEAARQALINEINVVVQQYSIYINYRHLSVLVDWMTHRGRLTPINRNGINRIPSVSPLRKSSFEETVEMLYDAAIFSEIDLLRGVTENIIFGQICPIGTGSFKLLMDKEKTKDYKILPSQYAEIIEEDECMESDDNQITQTPFIGQTPNPYYQTPYGGQTPKTNFNDKNSSQFTPYNSTPWMSSDLMQNPAQSPSYNRTQSPSSPLYNPVPNSGDSAHYSPGGSENSCRSSPHYSPSNSPLNQSPSSPRYSNSIQSPSPQYANSQNRSSSPNQNSYTNSNQNSPRYQSVSSPRYNNQSSQRSNQGYSPNQYNSGSSHHQFNYNIAQSPVYNSSTRQPRYTSVNNSSQEQNNQISNNANQNNSNEQDNSDSEEN